MYKQPSGEIVAQTDEDLSLISRYAAIATSHDTGEPRPLRLETPTVGTPYTFRAGGARGIRSIFERAAAGQTTQDEFEILIAQQIIQELDESHTEHSGSEVEVILAPVKRAAKKMGRAALAFGSLNV